MRVILIANGKIKNLPAISDEIKPGDVLIAADGGARHFLSLGLLPQLVVGDFDSLSTEALNQLKTAGVTLQQHPTDKDETDLELALDCAMGYEPQEIIIFGALGSRWDMSISNLLLISLQKFAACHITIKDETQEIALLRSGEKKLLQTTIGARVSLIPISGDACGVTTRNLAYPLENETLFFGKTRGVSNLISATPASIELERGLLLMITESDILGD